MANNKSGLHKKISSIFDGVPVPKTTDEQQSFAPPVDSRGHLPPKPSAAIPQMRQPVQIPQKMRQDYASSQPQPDIFPHAPRQSISDYLAGKLGSLKLENFADKQKIKILIVPALVIILILVLYWQFAGSARPVSRPPEIQSVKSASDVPESAAIVWQKPEPYPVYMRDPTQTGSSSIGGVGSIAVRGIVYSDDKPSVVIGSEIKHEGDIIGEATIDKINHDSVEFSANGKKWTQRVQ